MGEVDRNVSVSAAGTLGGSLYVTGYVMTSAGATIAPSGGTLAINGFLRATSLPSTSPWAPFPAQSPPAPSAPAPSAER